MAVAALAPAAASAGGFEKQTYRVPVTQPDEAGAAVSLDTDVYLPRRKPPRRGFPLLGMFHGGGSEKTNGFDAGHARYFARHGYVTILYSARGHGDSDGQTTVVGPKEVRDIFDVLAWALRKGGRKEPPHPSFRIDRRRIGLAGYSQGGLHTNLAQAHARDRELNPYGIRFRALAPGNTPDRTFEALIENEVVKLSFGAGLLQTYLVGAKARVSPLLTKWIATAAADLPGLAGGEICEHAVHDTTASTMKQDLAVRSPGCYLDRMWVPSAWAQAFDDLLFTSNMAISMWRHMPRRGNRLYLSMGGHGAPSAARVVERDKLRWQRRFLDSRLRGRRSRARRVVYWARDPNIAVPPDRFQYPRRAWRRRASGAWPPPGARPVRYALSADGRAVRRGVADPGALPLAPVALDEASDPVAHAALSATPLGTSLVRELPATDSPGVIAGFETPAFRRRRELAGPLRARLAWVPASSDSQVVLKVFDRAPDGTLTLLGRGVRGVRGASAGSALDLRVEANQFAAIIRRGHSLLAWVSAADALFYKPYLGSAGGTLRVGPEASLTVRLRKLPRRGR